MIKKNLFAARTSFFVAGYFLGIWAPFIAIVKENAGLDDAFFGLFILCVGIGAMIAMPIGAALVGRFGCRAVLLTSTFSLGVMLPLVLSADSLWVLFGLVFILGIFTGATDCAINIQGIENEEVAARPMMSGFHALFSLGSIVGVATITGLMFLDLPLVATAIVGALPIVFLMGLASPGLLATIHESKKSGFCRPDKIVLFLGLMTFVAFLTEGAMLDWGAVYLGKYQQFSRTWAASGYGLFCVTLTIGRFLGDRIVERLGAKKVLFYGAFIAALGMGVIIFASGVVVLAGFMLVGIGCSNIIPILFSEAGQQDRIPVHQAIAFVSMLGYGGVLAGPALIGLVAQLHTLQTGLLVVMVLLVMICFGKALVHNNRQDQGGVKR